jgi:hypothetical protein
MTSRKDFTIDLHNFSILKITSSTNWCYEYGLSTTKDALNHGPTRTHMSHGHMWLNPDQEDVPRPRVMARWHHSFPSFIEALRASPPYLIKSPRRLPQDPAGIPSRFYQGIPPRVMILEDLIALVLCTKSIGQWPFTLVDRTL